MKLATFIFASGLVFGLTLGANAAGRGLPDAPEHPGYGAFQPPFDTTGTAPRGLRIERGSDEKGYYLRILLRGLDPQSVQVTRVGRSLLISATQSRQSEHRPTPQQPRPGYNQWSYSTYRSGGAMQRRISVPRDADIEAMLRTDGEGAILITLPRWRGAMPQRRYD